MNIPEFYLARRNFPPFAAGDADTIMDLDLTSSNGSTPAGVATHGFTVRGTPTFDSSGMLTASGHLYHLAFKPSDRPALAVKGTIMIECERAGLTLDQSQVTYFADSSGQGTLAAQTFLIHHRDTTNAYGVNIGHLSGATASFRMDGKSNNVAFGVSQQYLSRHVPNEQDSIWAKIIYTWDKTKLYQFIDGHLVYVATLSAPFAESAWTYFAVGGYSGAVDTNRFGNFHIRKVQISKKFSGPTMLPLRIGVYGDSFVKGCDASGTPAGDTVAQINAAQTGLDVTNITDMSNTFGQSYWMLLLQAIAWEQLGVYVPYYNGGKSGVGYATQTTQIPAAYADAVNAYRPEILIVFGSVNDINAVTPVTGLVEGIKADLDALIDGNTALRKILFFETIGGFLPPNIPNGVAATRTEHNRLISLMRAGGIDGYRGLVQYIRTYDSWGGDNYPPEYTIGASPLNLTSTGPASAGDDVHPTPRGREKIAAIVWPYLKSAILSRPARA